MFIIYIVLPFIRVSQAEERKLGNMKAITIILGILLAVGGIYCMLTPAATYAALGWIIGFSMLVEGVGSIVAWSSFRRLGLANGWTLAAAIISVVMGIFLLSSYALQFAVDMYIAYLIAIWLVFAGVSRIVIAVGMRSRRGKDQARGWVLHAVLGALIAVMGILCIFNPLSIVAGVGMTMGMSIVLTGAALVAVGFEL